MKDRVLTRVAEDAEFRACIVAGPKGTISTELGTSISEGFDVVVHEDSATTAHLVLPPSGEISEAEMVAVAGGVGYADWNPFPPS